MVVNERYVNDYAGFLEEVDRSWRRLCRGCMEVHVNGRLQVWLG